VIYGSVCSGIEAASVAWHPLGWRAAFFSEIEAFPRAVLKHRWPDVPLHGDFTTIQAGDYEPIDLLVGGTPCQSFSVAGLRGGMADERGNLALEYLKLANRLRPRWLVWENVPGVLSSNEGRDFGSFLGGLGELGYGWAYRVLDAQYFGLAQRRRRVFVVGYFGDWRRAAAVLFERHSLSGHPAPSREARKDVAPTLSARTQGGGGLGTDFEVGGGLVPDVASTLIAGVANGGAGHGARSGHAKDSTLIAETLCVATGQAGAEIGAEIAPTLNCNHEAPYIAGTLQSNGKAAGSVTQQDAEAGMLVTHTLRGEGFDASEDGTGRGIPLIADTLRGHPRAGSNSLGAIAFDCKASGRSGFGVGDIASTMRAMGHKDSHTNGGGHQAVAFHENQRAELTVSDTAGALKNGGGKPGQGYPALLQAMQVRRLTPRECERLQGFPDEYTLIQVRGKPAADGPRYKALGNSMAVPCMVWIGRRIAAVEALADVEVAA
jgi:DNA (cytosine-5)-methyltransferase 1